LLTRRVQLLPEGELERVEAQLELVGVALFETGDFERAGELIDDATRVAKQLGNERLAALATLEELMLPTFLGGVEGAFDLERLEKPTAVLERLGDEIGLAHALAYLGRGRFYGGNSTGALEAYERALELARRHGLRRDTHELQQWQVAAKYYGPTTVHEAVAFLDEFLAEAAREGIPRPATGLVKAGLLAMGGEFAAARELVREAVPIARELGVVPMGMIGMAGGHAELLAGAPEAAVELLNESWERYGELGETGFRSTVGTMLAEALVAAGREDEAEAVLAEVESFAAVDDFDPQARLRWVRALILAGRGEHEEAERLAREGVTIVERTDYLEVTADAHRALATVLEAAGRAGEATSEWRAALDLYERKGVTVRAAQVREHLAT
jgi:tetratricopeptide (TPR) repeat protein